MLEIQGQGPEPPLKELTSLNMSTSKLLSLSNISLHKRNFEKRDSTLKNNFPTNKLKRFLLNSQDWMQEGISTYFHLTRIKNYIAQLTFWWERSIPKALYEKYNSQAGS